MFGVCVGLGPSPLPVLVTQRVTVTLAGRGRCAAVGAFLRLPRPLGDGPSYALFVLDGKATFTYNWLGRELYTTTAPESLPQGKCTMRYDFAYDGGGPGRGGTGRLSVNGKNVAEGRIDKTVPVYFSTDDTFDVGEDWGTPMAPNYKPPFQFTGELKKDGSRAARELPKWHEPTRGGWNR